MRIVLIDSEHDSEESLQNLLRRRFLGAFISTYAQAMDFILAFDGGKLENMDLLVFDDQLILWFPGEENYEQWGPLDICIPGILNRWNPKRAQEVLVPFVWNKNPKTKIIVRTSFPEDKSLEGVLTVDKEADDSTLLLALSQI